MKRIAFVIDQKQDFYLSLSFLFLLKERMAEEKEQVITLALITDEGNIREFEPYLHLFRFMRNSGADYGSWGF